MEDENYVKRCEQKGHGCVKTRSMEDIMNDDISKRRKINSEELLNSSMSNDRRKKMYSPGNSVSPATSETSDLILYSLPSRSESSKFVKDGFKLLDLKGERSQAEISSMLNNGGFRREKTPSSVLCRNSGEMESSTTQNKRSLSSVADRKNSSSKMPSAADLEEFFSEAEKYEQKRFAEKYNYDIVKDMPLEGRYEWIPVKP